MWNDRRLAGRAARGDKEAFAAIFRRYEQDLYRYCVAILGDPHDAQDALQNTMVKALRALPGEPRRIALKPWLYRVAHNESIDLRRRTQASEPLADEVPALGASPEQRAADRGRLRDLLADIGELPARHRGALVMRELAGLDFEEIAVALGTSAGAARQLLYEARRGLQQMSDGREMECDLVTALLSDRDGRTARRRDVRAHLRDCPECSRFAEGIRSRSETLAGIAPLPAMAAVAIAKGALTGTAGGGAATAAAGGSSLGGTAGAMGGVAAKLGSTAALAKSAVAVVAVVAAGAVAAQRGNLLPGDAAPASGANEGVAETRVPPTPRAPGAAEVRARPAPGSAERMSRTAIRARRGVEGVGLARPSLRTANPTIEAGAAVAGDAPSGASAEAGRPAGVGADVARHAGEARPTHPRHPAHPSHGGSPARRAHGGHPAHQAHGGPSHGHPAHPSRGTSPAHPTHPDHPTRPAHPEKPVPPAPPSHSDPPTSSHPEPSSHPLPPTAEGSRQESGAGAAGHSESPPRPAEVTGAPPAIEGLAPEELGAPEPHQDPWGSPPPA